MMICLGDGAGDERAWDTEAGAGRVHEADRTEIKRGCSKMHRPHKAKRTKQISHFLRITAIKFKVEIFINENFSIKIALCYERNSPLDVPPYAFGQGGCAPSFRPFCTIFLKPLKAVAKLVEFLQQPLFLFTWCYCFRFCYRTQVI